MNARTATLTIGALFTVLAPAAHAATSSPSHARSLQFVVLGDGGGLSISNRSTAIAGKHVAPKKHVTVKKHASITALPDNHYQVLRNAL